MSVNWAAARREFIPLAKQTFENFQRHKAQWLAAAIAYFTMFAIAPLIIVVVEIAGTILGGNQGVLNQLYGYLAHSAGKSAADGIHSIVTATFNQRHAGPLAQIVGWVMFVLAAIGLFAALQEALNTVWDVESKKLTLLDTIRNRAGNFGLVIIMAFLLLLSLGINAMLTVASGQLIHVAPFFPTLMKIVDFAITFAVITAVFAFLFRYVPDCRIEWRDVWPGAAASSLLFVVGQFLLGWYLGRAGISSTYGAFGGLVVFLLWVNYTAQIMLLGAEFTHAYARRLGSRATQTTYGEVTAPRTAGASGR